VFGDNGTGKSTIADALEWYFTGQIEFLRHEGRQQAVRHIGAPHGVSTSVEIATTGRLGGVITYPNEVTASRVRDIASQETFLLRGRTLVQFVEKPKSEKWKALAQILGLDAVDQLRLELQRAKNELQRESDAAAGSLQTSSAALVARVTRVTEDGILAAIRQKCLEAGVDSPESLDQALDPAWAQSITGRNAATSRAVQLRSLASELGATSGFSLYQHIIDQWNASLTTIERKDRARLALFRAAETYLQQVPPEDACPLCGHDVTREALADRVNAMLLTLTEDAERLEGAEIEIAGLAEALEGFQARIARHITTARMLGVDLAPAPASPRDTVRRSLEERTEVDSSNLETYARSARSG
jgi:DNA repair exonuclease SbcCD ATPase subunit